MVNDNMDMIAMVSDVIAMISEVNLVGSNNSGWWVDTGATRHVCADKSMFHSFRAVDNGEKLYIGNSATADIKGEGDVILKMTFEKELKLTNVLYVPEIRKNLVSDWLLNKFGFRLVFESDKFILSKNQMYVGRGYAVNGMFKLNVMVVKNDINKVNSFAYLIESSNVWHGRLGHVWKLVEYGVSKELDMTYWGFLGVGTMFDIFQNIILIPYLEYGVLSPLDTAYWSLYFCGLLVVQARIRLIFLMDTAYWSSEL
ncbi:hypothetical protein Tco_0790476 [Tanacetum coccineum]